VATTFHVVIERPRDSGPGAAASLAAAMEQRYGIPAAQLGPRLAAGRLRVKSNVDRATADAFAKDLESIGAVCAILDAATGEPVPVAKPAAKAPLAAPPSAAPLRPSGSFSSGLAAASSSPAQQDLGALNSGEFALSTLDGADEPSASGSGSRLPAEQGFMPASFGPAAPVEPEAAVAPPLDPFAPPDAESEPLLHLDVDPATVRRPGKVSALPVPNAAPAPARRGTPAPDAAAPEEPAPPRGPAGLAGVVADRRVRLAAGVALAILIGFVPAHLVAAVREESAYAQVDKEIQARYKSVLTESDWDALDAMLARQIERKKDQRRSIALASFLIWGLVGGGVAFVWFRKVDWDAIVEKLEP
jgi:hypothetical protein